MKVVDFERSAQFGREIGAVPTMCFRNAYRGLARIPGARYVEGFVALELTPAPVAHGWIELDAEDAILDPTPAYSVAETGALAYFAGQRWTLRELLAMEKANRYGLTLPFSEFQADAGCNVGLPADHPVLEGWRRAVRDCHAFRAMRHRERHATPLLGSARREADWLARELSIWTGDAAV